MGKFFIKFFLNFIFFIKLSNSTFAFIIDDNPNIPPSGFEPLKVKDGAIAWEVFAKTKEVEKCIEEDGYDYCDILPIYNKEILELNEKQVKLMGFMFPLGPMGAQTNFLLGPYPLSCPFDYHSPSSQIIEVFSNEPIKFSFNPITIEGILKVKYNQDTGVFYSLEID